MVEQAELTEQERRVLSLRYGFGSDEPHTLEEVGTLLGGLTRERIRQIEEVALAKLGTLPKGTKARLLDLDSLEALAAAGCPRHEIAEGLGCSKDNLGRHLRVYLPEQEAYNRGRALAKARRKEAIAQAVEKREQPSEPAG